MVQMIVMIVFGQIPMMMAQSIAGVAAENGVKAMKHWVDNILQTNKEIRARQHLCAISTRSPCFYDRLK